MLKFCKQSLEHMDFHPAKVDIPNMIRKTAARKTIYQTILAQKQAFSMN